MSQNSVFGRFHGLIALVLLFATNAHLLVIRGFLTSYDAIPVTSGVYAQRYTFEAVVPDSLCFHSSAATVRFVRRA